MQIGNRAMLAVELMAWLRTCSRVRPGKTLWLADRIQHSVSYTEALLARLRETGLIGAKKGAGGGYYLTRPADSISVAEILAVFDEPQVDVTRPSSDRLRSGDAAPASYAIDDLCDHLRHSTLAFLRSVSLARVDEAFHSGGTSVAPAHASRSVAAS